MSDKNQIDYMNLIAGTEVGDLEYKKLSHAGSSGSGYSLGKTHVWQAFQRRAMCLSG